MLTTDLMRQVRRLQIRTRRRVDDLFAGEYHSAFKGQGIEFAEVREYEPGDDVRAIDWNVTARTGRPFVKRFEEERQLTVVVAVDLSASGTFASVGQLKSRLAVELSAVLCMAASRNNDRAGLLIFSDHVELVVPPRKGRSHVLRLMRELLSFDPKGHATDLNEALAELNRVLRRRAIVFVVSDFQAPIEGDGGMLTPLRMLAARHEVVGVVISDPREHELPRAGLLDVRDPETGRRVVLDTSSRRVRRDFEARAARRREALASALRLARVDQVDVSTERPFVHDLARYFLSRERRR